MNCIKTKKPITDICRLKATEEKKKETDRDCPHVIYDLYQKGNDNPSVQKLQEKAIKHLPDHCNCALVAGSKGGMTLEEVGTLMGITRERVRQIEVSALEKIAYGRKLTTTDKVLLHDGFAPKKQGKRYRLIKSFI